MITEKPKKDFVLAYPIETVREAIKDSVRLKRCSVFKMDDVLNYYSFGMVYMLNTGILNIVLTKIDDNTTDCKFEMENTGGSNVPPSVLSPMMDSYLGVFSDLVSEKTVVTDKSFVPQEVKNKGCSVTLMMFFFLVALVGFILWFFVF